MLHRTSCQTVLLTVPLRQLLLHTHNSLTALCLPACLFRLSACPQLFAFLILPAYHHYRGTPSSSSICEFDNPAATQHSTGVRQLVHTIMSSQEGQRVPTYAST